MAKRHKIVNAIENEKKTLKNKTQTIALNSENRFFWSTKNSFEEECKKNILFHKTNFFKQ